MERALRLMRGLPQLACQRAELQGLQHLDAVEGHSMETGTRDFTSIPVGAPLVTVQA